MSSKPFKKLTEDEKDEVARARIKEILAKPELTEEDVSTVAACVAFLGTSKKIADKFAQALLDTAESLTSGLCVRCGEIPGVGKADCLICQGIRNVQTLKLVKQNSHKEMRIPIYTTNETKITHVADMTEEGTIVKPEEETLEEKLEREGDEKAQEALGLPDVELERDIELHREYPHTFEDGKFNKTKAVDTLTTLETMVSPTEADTEAIAHIRGHLELVDVDEDQELEEPIIRGPELKRCPSGRTTFEPDSYICKNCLHFKRKYATTPPGCLWSGWVDSTEIDDVDEDLEPGARGPVTLEPVRVPWSEKEIDKLRINSHLSLEILDWLFKNRTAEEIQEKLKELRVF